MGATYDSVNRTIEVSSTNLDHTFLEGLAPDIETITTNDHKIYKVPEGYMKYLGGADSKINTWEQFIITEDPAQPSEQCIDFLSGSRLQIGEPITVNGYDRYRQFMAIFMQAFTNTNVYFFDIQPGAVLDWYCGKISMYTGWFITRGTFNTYSSACELEYRYDGIRSTLTMPSNGDGVNVNGLKLTGPMGFNQGNKNAILNNLVTEQTEGINFDGFGETNKEIPLRNYNGSGRGNDFDFTYSHSCRGLIIDSAAGTGCEVGQGPAGHGLMRFYCTFNSSITDADSNPISGGKFFIQATDHGTGFTYSPSFQGYSTLDVTNIDSYTETSDVNGDFNEVLIFTGAKYTDANTGISTVGVHRLSKYNNDQDIFEIDWLAYGYKKGIKEVSMKGLNGINEPRSLIAETELVEPNEATALAYTTQEDKDKAFDHFYALWIRDYNRSIPEFPLTKTDNGLNCGSLNFDSLTGTAEGALSPTSATVRSATLNSSITTTGTISLQGGIAENQTVKDASLVTIGTLPSVLTVDNTILELAPGADITDFIELNGGSYRATADGNYIARGKPASIIDANGFTITVETAQAFDLTISCPAGGILDIFDNDDSPSDYQDRGTLLQSTNPTTGADVTYQHDKGGDDIIISFIKAGFKEVDLPFNLTSAAQSVDLNELIQIEENI